MSARLEQHNRWQTARSRLGMGPTKAQFQTLSVAQRLQRRGLTLTEIALELGEPRKAIVQSLYHDQVRK